MYFLVKYRYTSFIIIVCLAAIALVIVLTSASRYQSKSSMYIRGLIPRNSMELAEAVPIELLVRGVIKVLHILFHRNIPNSIPP